MIATERLVLREWRPDDLAPFNAMCRDPEVMVHLGPLQSLEVTRAAMARQTDLQAARGHCFWALERRDNGQFLGFCGLKLAPAGVPGLEDAIEIGWRLRRDAWGLGLAREAASASLAWGFGNLAVDRIFAITVRANQRSWGLMERLGMERRLDLDFDHPAHLPGDPLRPHITYAAARP